MPTTTKRAEQDACSLLDADTRNVKKMFKAYEELTQSKAASASQKKRDLAKEICTELTVHAKIEEEIFYPALRDAIKETDLLDEAEVEHASAKDLIAQIQGMDPSEELYDAKVTVLGEYIDHHVQEEEKEMFPKLKKTELDLKELGAMMAARKEQLLGQVVSA